MTRPAPEPTEIGPTGSVRVAMTFVEWMLGFPAGYVTQVRGLSRQRVSEALGNAVVPQAATVAVRLLGAPAAA